MPSYALILLLYVFFFCAALRLFWYSASFPHAVRWRRDMFGWCVVSAELFPSWMMEKSPACHCCYQHIENLVSIRNLGNSWDGGPVKMSNKTSNSASMLLCGSTCYEYIWLSDCDSWDPNCVEMTGTRSTPHHWHNPVSTLTVQRHTIHFWILFD